MKNLFLLFSGIFIIGAPQAYAQNKCFKVLYSQGTVKVTKVGKDSNPKTGMTLCGEFTLQIEKGASIGFVNDKNQSLFMEKEGKFNYAQLEAMFKNNALKSVGKAYLDLIVERLVNTEKAEDKYYQHHKKYFVDPAGVERGLGEKYFALPSKSKVLPGIVSIFTLNELNKTSISAQVFDFQTNSILAKQNIDNEKIFRVPLKDNAGKEAQYSIQVKSSGGSMSGEINYMLDVVKHPFLAYPTPEDEFSAMDWFGLGLAFEQNNYYVDALNCLVSAQKAKPEIDFYQDNIVRLLNLIGFEKDDATALAKYWKYNLD